MELRVFLLLLALLCCLATCGLGNRMVRRSTEDVYGPLLARRQKKEIRSESDVSNSLHTPALIVPESPYQASVSDSYRPKRFSSSDVADSTETAPPALATPSTPNYQCFKGPSHRQSIPTARPKDLINEKYITYHADVSTEIECAHVCCGIGPEQCQFTWIYSNRCYTVGCPVDQREKCRPRFAPALQSESTYIEMIYHPVKERPQTVDVPTTLTPGEESAPTSSAGDGTTQEATLPTTAGTIQEATLPTTAGPTTAETVSEPVTKPTGDTPPASRPTPSTGATPPPTTSHTRPSVTPHTRPPVIPPQSIIVEFSGRTNITLPLDHTEIFARTWPEPQPGEFVYHWERVSGPGQGVLNGKNGERLTMSALVPGVYSLKFTVRSDTGSYSERSVNVTVHARPHKNQPPKVVISPSTQMKITLPQNSVILDASDSTDDLDTDNLSFLWEEVQGRLDSSSISQPYNPVQDLTGLEPGTYKYKLTVTDSDGAQSQELATVQVLPGQDYPPTANAGNPTLLHLPKSEVYLYGNGSTDDKGIVSYQWDLLYGNTVDMEGSHTAILHVKGLTAGMYRFGLNVTDGAGQSASAVVSVDVLEEKLIPPSASAGENKTVNFPLRSVILDGHHSYDEIEIIQYQWIQLSGPTDIQLRNSNRAALNVSGLHIDPAKGSPTRYQFQLTVTNYRNLTHSANVTVLYYKDKTIPPIVNAGPPVNITLPQTTAVLNGSLTEDEFGIIQYHWTRSSDSPAAGVAVKGSDSSPVLILSGLVVGVYRFTLSVTNSHSRTSSASTSLEVQLNPRDRDTLQVHLEADISNFTMEDLGRFKEVLKLSLGSVDIHVQQVYALGDHVVVEFYATDGKGSIANATKVYYKLTKKGHDQTIIDFHIVLVEMKVCQLYCSFHGACDPHSKRCQCHIFWMENPFKAKFGQMETNCDWSVFYVVLVALLIAVVLVFLLWLCCCCCLSRRRKSRSHRRIKYAILAHKDGEENGEALQMLPKHSNSSYQQTSLMVSESDTEEELLFESKRLPVKASPTPPRTNKTSPNNNRKNGSS